MTDAEQEVVIVGAGNLGLLLFDCLQDDLRWRCVGFIDDGRAGQTVRDLPVFSIEAYDRGFCDMAFLAVGYPQLRQHMVERLGPKDLRWRSFVDRRSMVGANVKLGQGVLILNFATLSSDVTLGDFVYVSSYAGVGTLSVVGAYSAVLANAMVGASIVGEACVIGLRSTCLNVKIGDGAVVSPHSWVRRDVPPGGLAAGAPARVISREVRYNIEEWSHDIAQR